jgi:hypothetical protein
LQRTGNSTVYGLWRDSTVQELEIVDEYLYRIEKMATEARRKLYEAVLGAYWSGYMGGPGNAIRERMKESGLLDSPKGREKEEERRLEREREEERRLREERFRQTVMGFALGSFLLMKGMSDPKQLEEDLDEVD